MEEKENNVKEVETTTTTTSARKSLIDELKKLIENLLKNLKGLSAWQSIVEQTKHEKTASKESKLQYGLEEMATDNMVLHSMSNENLESLAHVVEEVTTNIVALDAKERLTKEDVDKLKEQLQEIVKYKEQNKDFVDTLMNIPNIEDFQILKTEDKVYFVSINELTNKDGIPSIMIVNADGQTQSYDDFDEYKADGGEIDFYSVEILDNLHSFSIEQGGNDYQHQIREEIKKQIESLQKGLDKTISDIENVLEENETEYDDR